MLYGNTDFSVLPFSHSMEINHFPNWTTYTSLAGKFTLQYPPEWSRNQMQFDPQTWNGDMFGVEIKGKDSYIDIYWGQGFGGGCNSWEKITVGNKKVDTCHFLENNGSEKWTQISQIYNGVDYEMEAGLTHTNPQDRQTIFNILSTFQFSN
jgi:hypothetical protein